MTLALPLGSIVLVTLSALGCSGASDGDEEKSDGTSSGIVYDCPLLEEDKVNATITTYHNGNESTHNAKVYISGDDSIIFTMLCHGPIPSAQVLSANISIETYGELAVGTYTPQTPHHTERRAESGDVEVKELEASFTRLDALEVNAGFSEDHWNTWSGFWESDQGDPASEETQSELDWIDDFHIEITKAEPTENADRNIDIGGDNVRYLYHGEIEIKGMIPLTEGTDDEGVVRENGRDELRLVVKF